MRRRLTKTQRTEAAQRVGKAFNSRNGGGVTWVLGQNSTGAYITAFLSGDVWTERMGTIHPDEWEWYDGPEVAAPQAGDAVKVSNPFGREPDTRIVAQRNGQVYFNRP